MSAVPPGSPRPIDELRAAREALSDASRSVAIERQHRLGKLSARERIAEHKVERIATHCLEHGCPLVLLLDGGGHRIQEGLDSRHFAEGSRYFQIAANLSGWVPTVAVIMGPGFAGPSNFAALSDLVIMVRDTST